MQGIELAQPAFCIPACVRAAAIGGVLVTGAALAEGGGAEPLDLWTADAPIASVLAFVVDDDTFDLRIASDIEGTVSGRLRGSVSEVLEPLLDEHHLTVHHDGSTVWFDRRDRDVVVRTLIENASEPALAEWIARELGGLAGDGQGSVLHEGNELVIAGTRAYVQDTLGRIDAARSALGEADQPLELALDGEPQGDEPEAADDVVIADPADVVAVPEETGETTTTSTADNRRYLSISDVPGFNTDYR